MVHFLDADEFYIDDPRQFLARAPRSFPSVWKQDFAYMFTEEDLKAYQGDPSLYSEAFRFSSGFATTNRHSEFRLFRHETSRQRR